jgi:hypothetical protein
MSQRFLSDIGRLEAFVADLRGGHSAGLAGPGEEAGVERCGKADVVRRHDLEAGMAPVEVVPPRRLELGGDPGSAARAVCGLLASGRGP